MADRPPPGLLRRFLTTLRHTCGLLFGGLVALLRDGDEPRGWRRFLLKLFVLPARPFLDRKLVRRPLSQQLRERLVRLGPTYIKLGQVLSLRQDLLPRSVTDELSGLLDHLPVISSERFLAIVSRNLGQPADEIFAAVFPEPLGSASIAQIHRARTRDGHEVVLKVVKPGIKETLRRDAVLLRGLANLLQLVLPRYQPKRLIAELVETTSREVDLRLEADNAETFAENFADRDDIVFPRIDRRYSTDEVLCMEYLDGLKPTDPQVQQLYSSGERRRLIELGAESILRMLYRDGFFHADLHPANLLVLRGGRLGFLDLGIVGRFDERLRRVLLYYFYSTVTGDAPGAARYLSVVARPGPGADVAGFRREVEELSRRWLRASSGTELSLAQLILHSMRLGARYRMTFPSDLVLMSKAIVTFEGVGNLLEPGFDIAAASRAPLNKIFLRLFDPLEIARTALRSAPEFLDALVKMPLIVEEGLRMLDDSSRPQANPLAGLPGAILGGFLVLAGALIALSPAGRPLWAGIAVGAGLLIALFWRR